MAVGDAPTGYHPVPGVRLAAVPARIKYQDRHDLVLMEFARGSETAAVFTRSHFAAAPVIVGRRHLAAAAPRYFLINSGNANAAVGDAGLDDAMACCQAVAEATDVDIESVIPFSTGVIGERLPVDRITAAVPAAVSALRDEAWLDAARGIMTTDTRPKIASRIVDLGGRPVTITGIAKGAGMIQPNMATMLAYVATDARIDRLQLQQLLETAVARSFNRITVDSDTSTNDSCMLTATGVSNVDIAADPVAVDSFREALESVCLELAHGIVRDAEGATKFVEVRVSGGRDAGQCLGVAYSIANSPLIKTALFASDANWGRIVMAIGKAPVPVNVDRVDVSLGDVPLMRRGQKDPAYTEKAGARVMREENIVIAVDLGEGDTTESVWTSDLSHEYVRINAEYRT